MKSEIELIDLKLNGYYILDLVGMATAGYSWVYTVDNENIVKISHRYITSPNKEIGSVGTERFTIIGIQRGLCTIDFRQIRSWEKDKPPLSVRKFLVNVE
jgi:predicted secreted protein